ncbi:MAG TPA: hypothetical protein VJL87_03885, partial [Bdellovibrionota bacterium]|nr:hypothetical protein [Bdellovibrionota bacterium]
MHRRDIFVLNFVTHLVALFCGMGTLVFEVVWTRQLGILLNGDTLAISTVLFAFLLGLGLGSEFFGRCVDRVKDSWDFCAWLALGTIAFGIGWYFLLSPGLFAILPITHGSPTLSYFIRGGILTAIIFPPTFLMGGFIPALLRSVVNLDPSISSKAGQLYAAHTFGAIVGALIAGFWLIPQYGTIGATAIAILIFSTI